ncbi:hypothetical protein UlMin_039819 [Ulmus minor]
MRTRARKAKAKSNPTPSESGSELPTTKIVEAKRTPTRTRQLKKNQTTPPSAGEGEGSAGARVNKPVTRRTGARTRGLGKGVLAETPEVGESDDSKVEELKEEVGEAEEMEGVEEPSQPSEENVGVSAKEEGNPVEGEETVVEDVGESGKKEQSSVEVEDAGYNVEQEKVGEEKSATEEANPVEGEETVVVDVGESGKKEQSSVEVEDAGYNAEQDKIGSGEVTESLNNEALGDGNEGEEVKEEQKKLVSNDGGDEELPIVDPANTEKNVEDQREDTEPLKEFGGNEGMECGEKMDLEEHRDEEPLEDNADNPAQENKGLDAVEPVDDNADNPAEKTKSLDAMEPLEDSADKLEEKNKVLDAMEPLEDSAANPEEKNKALDAVEPLENTLANPAEMKKALDAVEHLEDGSDNPAEKNKALDAVEHLEDSSDNPAEKNKALDAVEHLEDSSDNPAEKNKALDAVEHLEDSSDNPTEKNKALDAVEPLEDKADNPAEKNKACEDEHRELTAMAKERKLKKEREVFVGGLDWDAVEEDVRRVFEKAGEIVEIRLHKDHLTSKNKGYAFVEYTKKEHAKWALAEMKNPVIRGKRCATSPSEDNDTLFLGNICISWTKEAIKQKLKDYGIDSVENINLVPDAQREGSSRGFAFLEFSCHAEAMLAYKRLQKPDVIFGHPERTAKVGFAEPLHEPDPEIMASVKSVFVDGFPPHWDEDRAREQLKGYGEIVRVFLARNMQTARRKDFGFVDFTTHEAAVSCVDGINNSEFDDGNSKLKLKARLSNPMPKTQAVKGEMCGGFRIGHGGGAFPKFGRGFGRGGNAFNRANFQRGRGFHNNGRGRMGRMGYPGQLNNPYPDFHGRQIVGRGDGRGFRGGHYPGGVGAQSNLDRPWDSTPDRGWVPPYPPRRQPYSPEGNFRRPFNGSHFEDPYLYGDNMHGMKRPLSMRDPDPDFVEPSRLRPRLDYTNPASSFFSNPYHDAHGPSNNLPPDHYGPAFAEGPYPPFYGGDPSYGRGYY